MYAYRDAVVVVRWLTGLFVVSIGLCLIAAVSDWSEFRLLNRMIVGEELTEMEVALNDLRQMIIGFARIAILVPIVVMFCIWVHRANKNARALGAEGMRFTPGWSVGYFFIPIMNLFRPYQAVTEIYKASDPSADATSWASSPAGVTAWWWSAFLVNWMFARVSMRMSLRAETLDEMATAAIVGIGSEFIEVAAAVAAIAVVRSVQRMQAAKASLLLEQQAGGHPARPAEVAPNA